MLRHVPLGCHDPIWLPVDLYQATLKPTKQAIEVSEMKLTQQNPENNENDNRNNIRQYKGMI
jgi:hypothetical protein